MNQSSPDIVQARILQNQIEILWTLSYLLGCAKPDLVGKGGELDRMRDDLKDAAKSTKQSMESQAKEPEASGGLCGEAPHAVRVGEASADLPATSEHMDVTAGETATTFTVAQAAPDPLAKCEYCGNGPCENCMSTGYAYPDRAELALAAIELAKLPGDVYWLLAKGRTRPNEPLWAIQLTDLDANKIAEAEGDHPADCVRKVASMVSSTHGEDGK